MNKFYFFWFIAIVFSCLFLTHTNYTSQSNDSRFYTEQVQTYHNKSFNEMLTPKWGNNYGFDPNSYMRDQFPGQLLIGIAGTKIGLPAKHSLHIIELLFQVGAILLFFKMAKDFLNLEEAMVVFYGLLLMPNAFSYNLRGNHENGILFFQTLCLYCGLKINKSCWYLFISSLATFFLLFIKGPFAIFGFLMMAIGGFFVGDMKKTLIRFLIFFVLSFLIIGAFLYFFEKKYFEITGLSFLDEFYKIQFQQRALDVKDKYPFIVQKCINFFYYLKHELIYAMPWTLFLFILLLKKKFVLKEFIFSKLSIILILASLAYCGVFGLSNRMAGRYVYPAYYLFSVWAVLSVYFNSTLFQKIHQKLLQKYFAHLLVCIWTLAFYLHFFIL